MKWCVECSNKVLCKGKECQFNGYINKPEYDNCWHIYKYFINHKEHTLDEIAVILGISTNQIKRILDESLINFKNNAIS